MVCAWWGAWKAWEMGSENPNQSLWELLRHRGILAIFDEHFARDWNQVITVPYAPHALLTKDVKPLWSFDVHARHRKVADHRPISFYFRGGVLHGVDCKKNGTWVRRAAYEMFRRIKGSKFMPTENLQSITRPDGELPLLTLLKFY